MNCERCQFVVGDYVDGALAVDDREAVEAHLAGCAACRTIAGDFRAIRSAAGRLERHVPPPQAWTKIAAALDSPRPRWFGPPFLTFTRPAAAYAAPIFRSGLAIAATLLLFVGGTSWFLWNRLSPSDPAPRATAATTVTDPELAQTVEHELRLAEEHYQNAIAGLEQITRTDSSALDPQVAAVLQKNLEVIDQAIGESRAALQTQPASEVAQESLFEALRNKVALLQDTVALINEMRKGNQEGTARIVSGLSQ
jgi:anti-sigma factor RsiW